jgi:hypothetical protein
MLHYALNMLYMLRFRIPVYDYIIQSVTLLVLQVYFGDHTESLDNPNMDTQSEIINYHSDFLIGLYFRICSSIGNITITLPLYQQTDDSDQAERK